MAAYLTSNVHKYSKNQISVSKKCLWPDVEMTFAIRYLLDVEFRFSTDIHPILMSKKCMWSDAKITFVIRCPLDVELRL